METHLVFFTAGLAIGLMIGVVIILYITIHKGGV